jgi:putative hydrolase of the HAD superfamily
MRWDVAREIAQAHGLPRASVFETLYRTPAWRDLERGVGDAMAWAAAAHRALEAQAGRALPRLHDDWRAAQRLITGNVELARRLRSRYRVSVLSNADLSLRSRIRDDHGLLDVFDDVVVSAEVGMAKPDPEIFHLAARRLGVPTEACVFVDDWDVNVKAAREVGMSAVHFRVDKGDDLEAQLAALGVRPGG